MKLSLLLAAFVPVALAVIGCSGAPSPDSGDPSVDVRPEPTDAIRPEARANWKACVDACLRNATICRKEGKIPAAACDLEYENCTDICICGEPLCGLH